MTTAATLSIAETYAVSNPFPLKQHVPYPKRQSLPAVWMRSGTSKGLFIHRKDLPEKVEQWGPILLSAMGSSNPGGRQIDGIGGATSTTSKVAVIAKSTRPNIDVDYTFVQVAPDQEKVDMTGNCGNIASGVGPFSLDEGLVGAIAGQSEVSKFWHIHVFVC
jgi:2-methylaconitate cis-trans-isomerase PrpF